jgi:4'-phosphopantetheinyl transferase
VNTSPFSDPNEESRDGVRRTPQPRRLQEDGESADPRGQASVRADASARAAAREAARTATRAATRAATCTVRVWHAATAIEGGGRFETACERMLDPQERKAANRFRRPTTRNQHVVGRAMARCLLGNSSVPPQAIRFAPGPHGKPFIAEPAELERPFNIAHTDGLVLCGVADAPAELVGVDVESLARKTSTELAERYFAEPEVRFLRGCPADQQTEMFLRIWTLKEAFIKAIGTGLHTPLSKFAFQNLETDSPVIEFLSEELADGRDWTFRCLQPREGYIAATAIASADPVGQLDVELLCFEEAGFL